MPHQVIENNNTPQLQPLQADENEDYDENDVGVLFSCRCESARPVTTLLSCLRNVSLSNHTTNAASTGLSSSTASQEGGGTLLTSSSRMTQAAAAAVVSGGGYGGKAGKVQYATVFVTEKSLTFQVYGVGKQSRATVDLQAGLFSEYYVAEQIVPLDSDDEDDGQNDHDTQGKRKTEVIRGGEFAINLTTVLECLCVLGPNNLDRTTLCLSYDSRDAIFKIELLEQTIPGAGSVVGGSGPGPISAGCIISNCAIPALAVEDDDCHDDHDLANDHQFGSYGFGHQSLDVAFRSHPIVARARIKSDFLKDAIMELTDVGGSVCASIGLSKKYGLELATFGHSTECHVVVPYLGNHPEIFVSLEGVDGNFDGRGHRGGGNDNVCYAYSYPLHSVLSAMRGLEIASETCISINANGMIAIQHQVLDTVGNGDPNYIDFVMGCLDEGHDSNDGVDEAEAIATTNDQGYESVYDNTQQSNNNNTPFSDSQEEEEQLSQQQQQQQQQQRNNHSYRHHQHQNQNQNNNHGYLSPTPSEDSSISTTVSMMKNTSSNTNTPVMMMTGGPFKRHLKSHHRTNQGSFSSTCSANDAMNGNDNSRSRGDNYGGDGGDGNNFSTINNVGRRRIYPCASTTSGVSSEYDDDDYDHLYYHDTNDDEYFASRGAAVCSVLLHAMAQIDERIKEPPSYTFDTCATTVASQQQLIHQQQQQQKLCTKRKGDGIGSGAITSKRRSATNETTGKVVTIHRCSFACTASLVLYKKKSNKNICNNKNEIKHGNEHDNETTRMDSLKDGIHDDNKRLECNLQNKDVLKGTIKSHVTSNENDSKQDIFPKAQVTSFDNQTNSKQDQGKSVDVEDESRQNNAETVKSDDECIAEQSKTDDLIKKSDNVKANDGTCSEHKEQIVSTEKLEAVATGASKRDAKHIASAKLLAMLFPECKGMVEVKAAAESARERYAANKALKQSMRATSFAYTKQQRSRKKKFDAKVSNKITFANPLPNDPPLPNDIAQHLLSCISFEKDYNNAINSTPTVKDVSPPPPASDCLAKLSLSDSNDSNTTAVHSNKISSKVQLRKDGNLSIPVRQMSRQKQFEDSIDAALQQVNDCDDERLQAMGHGYEGNIGRTVLRRASVEDRVYIINVLSKEKKKNRESSDSGAVDSTTEGPLSLIGTNDESGMASLLWGANSVIVFLTRVVAMHNEPPLGCAILILGFSLYKGRILRVSDVAHSPHLPKERFVDYLQKLASKMKCCLELKGISNSSTSAQSEQQEDCGENRVMFSMDKNMKDILYSHDLHGRNINNDISNVSLKQAGAHTNAPSGKERKMNCNIKPLQSVKEEESDDNEGTCTGTGVNEMNGDQLYHKRLKLK